MSSEKVQKIAMLGYGLIANNPLVIQRTKHMAGETARQFCLDILEKILVDDRKDEPMKKELVTIVDGGMFTDSMLISEGTGNQHKSVVALIRKHKKRFERWGDMRFSDLKSLNPRGGRPTKVYQLNEEQAYYLITLLDNNEIVADFKSELVDQFIKARNTLRERQTPAYIEARQTGKLVRREFTDVLQQLEGYAKAQGSRNHGRFYSNYTRFINKILGVRDRETATTMQLLQIQQLENITGKFVLNCMNQKIHYKEIYPRCKQHLSQFMAYINGEPLRLTA